MREDDPETRDSFILIRSICRIEPTARAVPRSDALAVTDLIHPAAPAVSPPIARHRIAAGIFPLYFAVCRDIGCVHARMSQRADLLTRLRARELARSPSPSGTRCRGPEKPEEPWRFLEEFTINAAKEVVSRASPPPRLADTI
jgi:hypothetical protein